MSPPVAIGKGLKLAISVKIAVAYISVATLDAKNLNLHG
jgi:hypothetical protein